MHPARHSTSLSTLSLAPSLPRTLSPSHPLALSPSRRLALSARGTAARAFSEAAGVGRGARAGEHGAAQRHRGAAQRGQVNALQRPRESTLFNALVRAPPRPASLTPLPIPSSSSCFTHRPLLNSTCAHAMPCHAAHEPRVCTTSHCLLLLAPKSLPSFQQPHCLHSAYFPSRHAQCTPSMPPLSPLRHAFISRVLSSTRPPPCQRGQVENGKAQAANFPFCTIEPNVGVVAVPDPRLGVLSDLTSSKRTLPATVEFVDIAGLVKGASQGEVRCAGGGLAGRGRCAVGGKGREGDGAMGAEWAGGSVVWLLAGGRVAEGVHHSTVCAALPASHTPCSLPSLLLCLPACLPAMLPCIRACEQGLGNKFLSHIREVDSVVQVMCAHVMWHEACWQAC
ncbi:unnamed protein product [Closterium sp. NIES-64]|nr:unnamed protein product [Closterium sp. NIES-64]